MLQPSEVLYKKPVLVERGSFRPVTHVNIDMLALRAARASRASPASRASAVVALMEITMRNLLRPAAARSTAHDFLARADVLAACGKTVLISDYFEYYRLAAYLGALHQAARSASRMGAGSLRELFDEKYYAQLDGGILESFGRLFKNDLKLYIYPLLDQQTGELTTVENLEVAPELRKLYGYLVEQRLHRAARQLQPGLPHDLLARDPEEDQSGDPTWETMVPPEVAEVIKRQRFLDYRAS